MGVGAGLYMYDVVVKKFTFAISFPDEFLLDLATPLCVASYFWVAPCPRYYHFISVHPRRRKRSYYLELWAVTRRPCTRERVGYNSSGGKAPVSHGWYDWSL